MNKKKGWMNHKLFVKRYENCFIPNVKKLQEDTGKNGNVLLVLDNALSHPCPESLEQEDSKFTIFFLSPNVTSPLQINGPRNHLHVRSVYTESSLSR